MTNVEITLLVENSAGRLGVLAEHGLSFLIETGGEKILFDTGQGFVLKHNLQQMNLTLSDVKTVVLSHGHYDHTGGLHSALAMMNHPVLYAHPAVIEPKFVCYPNAPGRKISIPDASREALLQADWIHMTSPINLSCGLRLTGPVPRINDFEDIGGPFFRDADGSDPDLLPDDQAAFVETETGTVVILGCAHSGVINTLRYIQTLTANRPIHTVIGGMHLHSTSERRMNSTVEALRQLNIRRMFPCHCTGFDAAARLWKEFPGQVSPCPVGTIISI